MVVDSVLDIKERDWKKGIGDFRWREFNYSYLKALSEIGEGLFKYIILDKVIIPYYYDDNNISNTSKEIMGSFLKIMCSELEVKEDNVALVFLPRKLNEYEEDMIRKEIVKICNMIKITINFQTKPSLMFFYSEKDLNICNVLKSIANITKIASYNSGINIKNKTIQNYEQCLPYKRRNELRKAKKTFLDNNLVFKRFRLEEYVDDTYFMYQSLSDKYNDPYEPYDFWIKLIDIDEDKLQWYGIFKNKKLIRFTGFWIDDQNVILSMSGRDEDEIEFFKKKTNVYFMFMYKLIETTINLNFSTVYTGYGLKEAKSRMYFDIVYQNISFIK